MRAVNFEADRSRMLRFDYNALCDIEGMTGKPLVEITEDMASMQIVRVLLFCGLKHEDKDLTLKKTGDIIQAFLENGNTLEKLAEKITKALTESGIFQGTDIQKEGECLGESITETE